MNKFRMGFLNAFLKGSKNYSIRKKVVFLSQKDKDRLINAYKSKGFSESETIDIINHNWKIIVIDHTQ